MPTENTPDLNTDDSGDYKVICPSCKSKLVVRVDSLFCTQCYVSYPVKCGIPCFTSGSSAWSFPDKNWAGMLLDKARTLGWEEALEAMDPDRADWISGRKRFPLSILCSPKGRSLDCGCGWGGLTFWLSREFDVTYALDNQIDGLHFINLRASQDNIKNVKPVQGSILSMPFADHFFDVVVLNGVLEWIGTMAEHEHPEVLQKNAMREIKRVLKPEGTLCLAIENRFGLQYFLGYHEEHTGLRFISILPRPAARSYYKLIKKTEFRTITHSRQALVKMIKECGLPQVRVFAVYPSYRNARYLTTLNGPGAIFFLFTFIVSASFWAAQFSNLPEKVMRYSARLMNLAASFFSPSWIIMASESNPPRTGVKRADSLIELGNNCETGMAVVVNNRNAGVFIIDRYSGKMWQKCSIPMNDKARMKARISKTCLEYIRAHNPMLADHCLHSDLYKTLHGPITVTSAVPGKQLNIKELPAIRRLSHIIGMFAELDIKHEEIPDIYNNISIKKRLMDIIREYNLSTELDLFIQKSQIIHGDLNSGNIFVDTETGKITLIDFEHVWIGPAVLNWYDFLLRNFILNARRYPMKDAVVIRRLEKLSHNVDYFDCTKAILEKYEVHRDFHGQFMALYMGWLFEDKIVNEPKKVMEAVKRIDFSMK